MAYSGNAFGVPLEISIIVPDGLSANWLLVSLDDNKYV